MLTKEQQHLHMSKISLCDRQELKVSHFCESLVCVIFLAGCTDIPYAPTQYYDSSYEYRRLADQQSWDTFEIEQTQRREAFNEEQRFNRQEFDRDISRLQAGLPPIP